MHKHVCVVLCGLMLPWSWGMAAAPRKALQAARITDSGGYVRVVNATGSPYAYDLELKFHKAPWAARQRLPQKGAIAPGEASAWIHIPDLAVRNPVTVILRPPRSETKDILFARVEFAGAAATNAILRTLPLTQAGVIVECSHAAFRSADELSTDAELGAALLATVKTMSFKGKAPVLFPTGYPGGHDSMFEAGRLLGFNAIHMAPGLGREVMQRHGYRHVFTYSHLLGMPEAGSGYRLDKNREHAAKAADAWRKAGMLDSVYYVSVRDEAELDVGRSVKKPLLASVSSDPVAWSQVFRAGGVRPEDLMKPGTLPPAGLDPMSSNYWSYVACYTSEDRKTNPRGVYDTMKVAQGIWATRFANAGAAFHEAMGSNVLITANIHINAFIKDNLSGIDPWLNYSRLRSLDSPQSCDYWIGFPQQEEFLIDLLRCAGRPHDKPIDAMLQAQSSYMPQTPRSLKLRAMSAVGAGARSFSFYEWGPRYLATENWYDLDSERLRTIGEINHAVGWVEDIVMAGHPASARIAILYSHPSELWDRLAPAGDIVSPRTYLAERRALYHLLRGLQQPVDMIQDEVLPAEQGLDVDRYNCIFMSQRCITAKGADMLLDWVKRGGTLIGDVSCGQFDELEQPWSRMTSAFGLKSLAVLTLDKDETDLIDKADITVRHLRARVGVDDASVLMRFADGSPAVTEKPLGKGRLIYAAWALGSSYHSGMSLTNGVLLGLQESVRPVVAKWIRPAGMPACEADHPLVSARLIRSGRDSAVFLVNSTGGDPVDRVRITLRGVPVKRVESLERGTLQASIQGDNVAVELPLGLTDVLRITGP